MSNPNNMFRFGATQRLVGDGQKNDPFKVPMPKFWAVEDPMMVNDAIPRDLATNASKQGLQTLTPTAAKFNLFGTEEEAIRFAQRMNRPSVILEIVTVSKVVPQLPRVEKYVPPKETKTLTVTPKEGETVEFTNKS